MAWPVVLPLAVDMLALAAAASVIGWTGIPGLAYAVAVLAVLAFCGQHRLRICLRVSDQVGRIVTATAIPLPLLLLWLPVGLALRLALSSAICVMILRALVYRALRAAHRRGLLTEPTLLVGAGELAVQVADLLHERRELGLRVIGFVDGGRPLDELPHPLLGSAADLQAIIWRFRVRRVIVCFPADHEEDLVPALRACRRLRVDVCLVPRLHELGVALPRSCLDEVWGIPLIPLRRTIRAGMLLKRSFDILAAAILLAVVFPVLLALAAATWLRSGSPVIFRQVRVTGDERKAAIMKLRTLDEHSDSDTSWKVPIERSTMLGRWLRASHLDELPQLVNVLRGEMSLVGPRPERPYFVERFSHEIRRYEGRNRMPAGITGWAQVHGLHGDTSIRDRVRFDNQYIEYWSPWLDAVILARTVAATVTAGLVGKQ